MKKILYMVLIVICISTLLTACGCEHQWTDATCSAPKTCTLCGETEGTALAVCVIGDNAYSSLEKALEEKPWLIQWAKRLIFAI